MASYYHKATNEKVDAEKVKDIKQVFENAEGEITVTKGNYIVTQSNGNKFSVAEADFALYYSKTKGKDTVDQVES